MKKFLTVVCSILMVVSLVACGNSAQENESGGSQPETGVNASSAETENSAEPQETTEPDQAADAGSEGSPGPADGGEAAGSKTLVAYFSLAGEQYAVGVIEEGNTSIIAHMIADQTGADLFEIEAATPYPQTHSELLDVSQQEMAENARPEFVGDVENWEDYDTVFIGYPNWWGDMPMIVYHFLESHDWGGKTVVPFCTHGGSGLSGTESTIEDITGGTMMDGFAISGETAQNDRETA